MTKPVASVRLEDVSAKILCERYKSTTIGDCISSYIDKDDPKEEFGLNKLFNELDCETRHGEKGENENLEDTSLLKFKKFLKKNARRKRIKPENNLLEEINSAGQAKEVKKKKKKRCGTICLSNCRYSVVRRIAKQFGMREVDEEDQWNIYWTDFSVSVERAKEMKRFQKVNHFPGMSEICRKDLLARNLNRMLKMFPKDYNFFPKSWCIPADLGEIFSFAKSHPTRTYIVKPDLGCQGKGIFLTKSLKELRNVRVHDRMICQVYISKPYLVDGFKFDLRVYTLITSVDPLTIFVYNDGLARFATSRYKEPAGHNTTNLYMHLTNYAVNKHSRTYVDDDVAGSKRRLSALKETLYGMNVDVDEVWASIDDIIIKTVIAAHPVLKHSYNACFANHDLMYACFELLGFDILLDHKLKPYILEVNHSPSFHTDASIDRVIKENLLMDTFSLLNLSYCHKRKALEQDKRRVRDRLLQPLNAHANKPDVQHCSGDGATSARIQEWEMSHLGNYRLIFPNNNTEKYDAFFHQNQCSIFQETFASRAREEARRMAKEQYEANLREEMSRRVVGKDKDNKEKGKNKRNVSSPEIVNANIKTTLPVLEKHLQRVLCSFEPSSIEESEESKRIAAMSQRDYLVRNVGLMELIYKMMKMKGNLRSSDILKYAAYDTSGHISESIVPDNFVNGTRMVSLMKILPQINSTANTAKSRLKNFPVSCTLLELPWPNDNTNVDGHNNGRGTTDNNNNQNKLNVEKILSKRKQNTKSTSTGKLPDLSVTCEEAAVWIRPRLPSHPSKWMSWNQQDAKNTKTTVARRFSNNLKLRDLERRLTTDCKRIPEVQYN